MRLDLTTERTIRLADVPKLKWLPRRRGNTRLHISTVFRWADKGMKGHRLETLKVGGTLVTTEAALLRFFERLSTPPETDLVITPSERQQQIDAADRRLAASGI